MAHQTEQFTIRPATAADVDILARHRCEMFKDMGQLQDRFYQELAEVSARYFAQAIPAGEYVAWLVAPRTRPDLIVAGGGMQLRPTLPRPARAGTGGLQQPGPEGLIMNVYTEKEWRRKGLAELVIRTILQWSRDNEVASVVLHASSMGRPLYERLGFLPTSEMYYPL